MEKKMSCEKSDLIIIECVENNVINQTKMFDFKNKRKDRRCKRKVKLFASADDDKETLDRQKVGVKKQRITCIIDIESIEQIRTSRSTSTNRSVITSIELNTHRDAEVTEYSNNKKIQDCYHLNPTIKRVVPQCFRQTCQTLNNSLRSPHLREKISKFADRFEINAEHHRCAKLKRRHQNSNNGISFAERRESKLGYQQRAKHKRCSSRKERYKDMLNYHNSLSPISLSPLKDSSGSTITYEDISSDNLSCSSEDLDTLIRRTKRREKNMAGRQEATLKQSHRQGEEIIQLSSDEKSEDLMSDLSFCSELEASVHSQVTLRLAEVDEEAYSPTMHPSYINEYSYKTSPNFINQYSPTMNNAAHQNGYIQCFEQV